MTGTAGVLARSERKARNRRFQKDHLWLKRALRVCVAGEGARGPSNESFHNSKLTRCRTKRFFVSLRVISWIVLWLSSSQLDLSRHIAHANEPRLHDLRIDTTQVKLSPQGRINKLHGIKSKTCNEFLATIMRLRSNFNHRRAKC
jgi:hypothetical protein